MDGAVQLQQEAERLIDVFRDKNDISPEIPIYSVHRDKIVLNALTDLQARIQELIAQKKVSDGTKRTKEEVGITERQIAELKGTLIGIIRCYTDTLPQQELASFSIDGKSSLVFLQEKIEEINPEYRNMASMRADEIYTTLIGGKDNLPLAWVRKDNDKIVTDSVSGITERIEDDYEVRHGRRTQIFESIKNNEIQTLEPIPYKRRVPDSKTEIYYGEKRPIMARLRTITRRTVDRGTTDNVVENAAREVVELSQGMDVDYSKKVDESEPNAKPEEPSDDDDAR